jgi:hypothetical protein
VAGATRTKGDYAVGRLIEDEMSDRVHSWTASSANTSTAITVMSGAGGAASGR